MIPLNSRDPRPIYEQIMDNLRRLIVSGGMTAGEKLPSVREMASQLAINPNTIQRAYRELENEGYILSLPGKGSFVARREGVEQTRIRSLWRQLDEAAAELRFAGVSEEEILRHIREGANHD